MAKQRNGINGISGTNGNTGEVPHLPELELTPIQDWKRLSGGIKKRLISSGRVIVWKPVDLTELFIAGEIPDFLTAEVTRIIWAEDPESDTRTNSQRAIDWRKLLNLVAAASLAYPIIKEVPQGPDEVTIQDVLYEEKLEIYRLATDPLQEVLRFRLEQVTDLGDLPEGEPVQQAAE